MNKCIPAWLHIRSGLGHENKKLSRRRNTAQCFVSFAKSLKVTQYHWKWHFSGDRIRVPIRIVQYMDYGPILYIFRYKAGYW